MSKLLFFDLETTGLDPNRHGIHQISGEIIVEGVSVESFNYRVRPNPLLEIDDDALKVSSVTREMVTTYEPMEVVFKSLKDLLGKYINSYKKGNTDKFYLVGYNNSQFDNQFLKAFFLQNGDEYFYTKFWSNSIDVMVLATVKLMDVRSTMPNFKLATVAKHLGISVDESRLHDASYDIYLTREIYNKLILNNK